MVKGRLLAACSCLALCTLAQGAEEAPAAINWLRSMSEGAAAQRGTDKLLVVYLGGEHCPWCRKMEAETHADAKVISAMAKAVAVKPSGTDAREGRPRRGRARPGRTPGPSRASTRSGACPRRSSWAPTATSSPR